MEKKGYKNKLLFTKLQKGNTGVGKIPAIWTILKFIHVEVTDENICLGMEQKIKLYAKSGTKLHVVFENFFFFLRLCHFLIFFYWYYEWVSDYVTNYGTEYTGTHLVKSQESQSRTNVSHFKKSYN